MTDRLGACSSIGLARTIFERAEEKAGERKQQSLCERNQVGGKRESSSPLPRSGKQKDAKKGGSSYIVADSPEHEGGNAARTASARTEDAAFTRGAISRP